MIPGATQGPADSFRHQRFFRGASFALIMAWHSRRDSNPRPYRPERYALPLSYGNRVVPPERFELPTLGSVDRCSGSAELRGHVCVLRSLDALLLFVGGVGIEPT